MASVLPGWRHILCRPLPRPWTGRCEQGLGAEIGDADEREVGEPFDAQVTGPPLRRELAAEDEEAFELEEPVARAQQRARDRFVSRARIGEQISEDAEVERHLL